MIMGVLMAIRLLEVGPDDRKLPRVVSEVHKNGEAHHKIDFIVMAARGRNDC